jgi:hypothetical protein
MSIITAKQVTDLLEGVEDYDSEIWDDDRILELSDEFAQPYFEEVLCKGKTFDYQTYTDSIDGNGLYNLSLPHKPAQELVSVTIGEEAVDLTTVYLYTNRIAMKTPFPVGFQNVVVVYKAGYTAAPGPVLMAIAMLCACHIARVVGGGGDALSTGITAGPITLKEAFSASGKYAGKIADWQSQIIPIARHHGGIKLVGKMRKAPERQRKYDPRTDSYE